MKTSTTTTYNIVIQNNFTRHVQYLVDFLGDPQVWNSREEAEEQIELLQTDRPLGWSSWRKANPRHFVYEIVEA